MALQLLLPVIIDAAFPLTAEMRTFGHAIKSGHFPSRGVETTTFQHNCSSPPCAITQVCVSVYLCISLYISVYLSLSLSPSLSLCVCVCVCVCVIGFGYVSVQVRGVWGRVHTRDVLKALLSCFKRE